MFAMSAGSWSNPGFFRRTYERPASDELQLGLTKMAVASCELVSHPPSDVGPSLLTLLIAVGCPDGIHASVAGEA